MSLELARPWWLLALPLAVLAGWHIARRMSAARHWMTACDALLLVHLSTRFSAARTGPAPWLLATGLSLAVLALSGPSIARTDQRLYRANTARLVALDLSASMNARDLGASRLEIARLKVIDLLRRTDDGQTGVIVFAGDAFLLSPLTDDTRTLGGLLKALDTDIVPVQGSLASRALALAGELAAGHDVQRTEIVLVTDGADPAAIEVAAGLQADGIMVSVLGVGTPSGAPIPRPDRGFVSHAGGRLVVARLDEERLRDIARAGGGRYARITPGNDDLEWLLQENTGAPRSALEQARLGLLQTDIGYWLMLLLLPLGALAFRRGWLLGWPVAWIAAMALPVAPTADAIDWETLWHRPDQLSATALAAGDYVRALQFAPGAWHRGTARFRAGQFDDAAAEFSEDQTVTGHYNRGTAFAFAGRFGAALEAFEQALNLDPNHEDALVNRAAVKALQDAQRPGDRGPRADAGDSGQPGDQATAQSGKPDAEQQRDQAAEAGSNINPSQTGELSEEQDQSRANGAAPPADGAGGQDESASPPRHQRESEVEGQRSSPDGDREPGGTEPAAVPTDADRNALANLIERVPDDPGGLLRRKFKMQYTRRQTPVPANTDPW